RSCHPRSERQRSRRTPCNLNPAMPFRGFSPCTQDHVRIPLHVCGGTRVTGVLRLRNCCASRSSFSAQDDSSLLLDRLSCKRHLGSPLLRHVPLRPAALLPSVASKSKCPLFVASEMSGFGFKGTASLLRLG